MDVLEGSDVNEFLIELVSVIEGLPELVVELVTECVREALGLIVTEELPEELLLGQVVKEELGLDVRVILVDPDAGWDCEEVWEA